MTYTTDTESDSEDLPQFIGVDELSDIGQEIGRGRFGVVHIAIYRGKSVAIKSAKADFDLEELALAVTCLKTEQRLFERITVPHRAVITFLGKGHGAINRETADEGFLVYEYLSGGSLGELLEKRSNGEVFDNQVLEQIVMDVSNAVAFLHNLSYFLNKRSGSYIVHRDISPDNILLTAGNRAKLADFGAAVLRDNRTDLGNESHVRVGKPFWMAPEVDGGRGDDTRYSRQSDVYVLGNLLWVINTSRKVAPFSGHEAETLLRKLNSKGLRETIDHDTTRKEHVKVILESWDEDPFCRPTAWEFAHAMKAATPSLDAEGFDEAEVANARIVADQIVDVKESNYYSPDLISDGADETEKIIRLTQACLNFKRQKVSEVLDLSGDRVSLSKYFLNQQIDVLKNHLQLMGFSRERYDFLNENALRYTEVECDSLLVRLEQLLSDSREALNIHRVLAKVEQGDRVTENIPVNDKDIVLLLGDSNVGKSTLIHYLAGSLWSYVANHNSSGEHILISSQHKDALGIETSNASKSTTRIVTPVCLTNHNNLIICDAPGTQNHEGGYGKETINIEAEVVNGINIMKHFIKAKSVRLVSIISSRLLFGENNENLGEYVKTLSGVLGQLCSEEVLPVGYFFSKFKKVDKEKINHHLKSLLHDIMNHTGIFLDVYLKCNLLY